MLESATLSVKRSPLAGEHEAAGAKLAVYHGAEVPLGFGDPVVEHHAVRAAAGLFDFSFRSKFVLTGEHRVRFLHRIVSNNIQALVPGQGTYATLLSAQGRILADLRIYLHQDSIWVDTDADLAEKAMGILGRYIIGDRVQIEPRDLGAVAVQGPAARNAVAQLFSESFEPPGEEMEHREIEYEGRRGRIVRLSSTGEEGFEIWLHPAVMPSFWPRATNGRGEGGSLARCGSEALEILRIEAGIPRYGPDLGEDTLPLEAGLLNAVSFNKGCYIGQEIVERARSRGHVNWKLMGLRFEPMSVGPKPGEPLIEDGKTVGEITSACYSPTLERPIALAYLRREVTEPGKRLLGANGSSAEVTALPFVNTSAVARADPAALIANPPPAGAPEP